MIQITSINQFSSTEAINNLPAEILPYATSLSYELLQLIALQQVWDKQASFPISEEGLFVVLKKGQIIGYGSVIPSPNAPPTAGIGFLNHCFIIPSERQKGYGTQLFQQLRQYATQHFGLLQLNEKCPLNNRMEGAYLDLTIMKY